MGKSQIKSEVQMTNHLQKWFKSISEVTNQITNHFLSELALFKNV